MNNDLTPLIISSVQLRGVVIYDPNLTLGDYIATQQVAIYSDSQAILSKEFPVEGIAGILVVHSAWIDDTNYRYIFQEYITRDNLKCYRRRFNINYWTDWKQLY